jgi:hypothetical protein
MRYAAEAQRAGVTGGGSLMMAGRNTVTATLELGNAIVEELCLASRSDIHSFEVYWPAGETPRIDVSLSTSASCRPTR